MKICVYGLWHLGCVTAACLSETGFQVVGLDQDIKTIEQLQQGKAPLYEPHLNALIFNNLNKNNLSFTSDASMAIQDADIIWVTFDTPTNEDNIANTYSIEKHVASIFPYLKENSTVLISSQLPVGTTRKLATLFQKQHSNKNVYFAYIPENLRLGKAIETFMNCDRIIIGSDCSFPKETLEPILIRFTKKILWQSIESAEMSKHALNSFLATSIAFANEISTICDHVGANAYDVMSSLSLDSRISKKTPLTPGEAFGGGTLARDVNCLNQLSKQHSLESPIINSILKSNEAHKKWALNCLRSKINDLNGKRITLLGLAYKHNTNAIRHSVALSLCQELLKYKVKITAYDPLIDKLPIQYQEITLCSNVNDAIHNADAIIISSSAKETLKLTKTQLNIINDKIVIDQCGVLQQEMVLPT